MASLPVFIFCFFLVQFGHAELTNEAESIIQVTHSISGASKQFIDDVTAILEKFQNNYYVKRHLEKCVRKNQN